MISYTINDGNGLEITGKMEPGDIISGLCCAGFDWECDIVIVSAWGHCSNPDCPRDIGEEIYRGVSCWDDEDIACRMIDNAEQVAS